MAQMNMIEAIRSAMDVVMDKDPNVKERRSETEAADILDEAVALLRSRRKAGEIIF
jgi:hypothetical protein